uniref:Reverse transcriptase domain-containing protein n=1 Tax=Strongyloides venezuelensis TaxID=75913 RepID=A0A0K0G3I0_STRVS
MSPNQTLTESQLIWTIGKRIKKVLADKIVYILSSKQVYGRKKDLKKVDDVTSNDKQVFGSNHEIIQLLKNKSFMYPKEKVKVEVHSQRGIKHESYRPSANRLEIMTVKVALETTWDMILQQV